MIKFDNVNLKLNKNFFYLYNINFQIEKSQKVLFAGSFEDGGTHILRLIAKIENKFEGKIFLNGKDINKINFKNEINLSMIPKVPVFFNNLTVRKNLEYVLKIRKFSKTEMQKIINKLCDEYDLAGLADKKITQLDNENKILISLIRASLKNNDIVLLDNFNFNLIENNKKIKKAFNNLILPKTTVAAISKNQSDAKYFENCKIITLHLGSIK